MGDRIVLQVADGWEEDSFSTKENTNNDR